MHATAEDFQSLIDYPAENAGPGYSLEYYGDLIRYDFEPSSSREEVIAVDRYTLDYEFEAYQGPLQYQKPLFILGKTYEADFYGVLTKLTPAADPAATPKALISLDLGKTVGVSVTLLGGTPGGTAFTASNVEILAGSGSPYIRLRFYETLYRYELDVLIRRSVKTFHQLHP
jgi:hypothetical protein